MEKVKILIIVLTLSIFGVIISSTGYAIPFVQATSSDGNNNAQTFSDDVPPSDDGNNNAQTFEGELLPQLSPSNEKVIQFEDNPPKTIAQSDNLQNPSIQADLNQSLPQQDIQLKQSEGKKKYDWELPNGKGCAWNDPLPGWPRHWICTDVETTIAWEKYNKTKNTVEDDRARHPLQEFSNLPTDSSFGLK